MRSLLATLPILLLPTALDAAPAPAPFVQDDEDEKPDKRPEIKELI